MIPACFARLVGFRANNEMVVGRVFSSTPPPGGMWRVLCKTRGRLTPGEKITAVVDMARGRMTSF